MNRFQSFRTCGILKNQQGVTLVLVVVMMFGLLGVAALVIDISNLYVVKNELQNAADAGALAGGRFLYNHDGTLVNSSGYTDAEGNSYQSANQIAYDAARQNRAMTGAGGALAVDVNGPIGDDIQRGHWSFASHSFFANDSTAPPDLQRPTTELDADTSFINAIRVVARRQATPVASFFARIFGFNDFTLSADAVAAIGFAGSLGPGELDQPIAICAQSIVYNDVYSCNVGRMINSGPDSSTSNTGGWTDFSQPCSGGASNSSIRPLVCGDGNPSSVAFGEGMGATNGALNSSFQALETCWKGAADTDGDGVPDSTWEMTLAVIDCQGNAVDNCSVVNGAVTLKVVWVQIQNPGYDQAPTEMSDTEAGDWPTAAELNTLVQELQPFFVGDGPSDVFPTYPAGTTVGDVFALQAGNNQAMADSGRVRWASFVRHFDLRNVGPADSAPYATFAQQSIYFLPSCTPHEPRGNTGGINYGILAEIPKLVE